MRNPNTIPKKAWVKNKTHGKADARAQKQSGKKPTEKAPVEETPVEEEHPTKGPIKHLDDAIFADDEPKEPKEDS